MPYYIFDPAEVKIDIRDWFLGLARERDYEKCGFYHPPRQDHTQTRMCFQTQDRYSNILLSFSLNTVPWCSH